MRAPTSHPHGSPWQQPCLRAAALKCGVVLFWLVVWQVAAVAVGSSLLIASPVQTLTALAHLVAEPLFWQTVLHSLASIFLGFLGAFVVGSALGVAAGLKPWLHQLLEPLMSCLKSIPVACLIVVLLLWVKTAGVTWACVALVVVPAYYFTLAEAVQNRPKTQLAVLKLMGTGAIRRALAAGLPACLPYISATSKTVVGMSWKAGVAAELIGLVPATLGERIYQAKLLLETADLFAWTAVIVALSFAFEKLTLLILQKAGTQLPKLACRVGKRDATAVKPESYALCHATINRGGVPVIRDFTLTLTPGSNTCLMAPSGAGKTTVLLALAGLLPLAEGECTRHVPTSLALQETTLIDQLSASDNCLLVAGTAQKAQVEVALETLIGPGIAAKPTSQLSGGQRRRVELVRALLAPGAAVLLDEPFSGLDAESHAQAAAFITDNLKGRALLVCTHDLEDAELLGAHIVHL